MKSVSVLGSTGSIGRQTLDIIRAHQGDFRVVALAAGRTSLEMLAQQVQEFTPEIACVPDAQAAAELKDLIVSSQSPGKNKGSSGKSACEIVHGESALCQAAAIAAAQIVVSGVVGAMGVKPTAAAIAAGKTIALANKETLVAAGPAIMQMAREHGSTIVPVDSEHSAIHQSLSGYATKDIHKIWLTASGGPFRTWTKEQIAAATVDDALRHPNWSMGRKITIDSATLMNKGLEIIEARWLFAVAADKIRVVIHPQSILHSAVEFVDRSIVGQLGMPDMHLPIHYALYWPQRQPSTQVPELDLVKIASLSFEEPDLERFPCLKIAMEAAARTDTTACVLNAANEVIVNAFLERKLTFAQIPGYISRVIERHSAKSSPSLEDILEADRWARQAAHELVGAKTNEIVHQS